MFRMLLFAWLLSPVVAGAAETLSCGYRPVSSVQDIGVHSTIKATIGGYPVSTRSASPDGPWKGREQILLSETTAWRDGRAFHVDIGPGAVTWREGDGPDASTYAVDRVNGDFYHWRGTRIVEGGRCQGTSFPF